MRHYPTLFFILLFGGSSAQNIGINTNGAIPHGSALLDVDASALAAGQKRGLLIPRVALVATDIEYPVGIPIATSLLVYNTATDGTPPYNVVPGHYAWDGVMWVRFIMATDPPSAPTCPPGFVRVPGRSYCIEVNERPQSDWDGAKTTCLSLGYRLCFPGEWRDACPNQGTTEDNLGNIVPLQDMTGNEEWTWNLSPISTIPTLGVVSCGNITQTSIYENYRFRCCFAFY